MDRRWYGLAAVVVGVGLGNPLLSVSRAGGGPGGRFTGPWDVEALSELPEYALGEIRDGVREAWFEGLPFLGEPTPGFAYLGVPECGCESGLPGVVLVHGGGQHASEEWVRYWMARGYAAVSMDLQGWGPGGALPGGGPALDADSNFPPFPAGDIRNGGIHHAVADIMFAHSILADQPEVDATRIGVNGMSWGGFLTGIVAGIDSRVRAAAVVYGGGFLHESSFWLPVTKELDCADLLQWATEVDVSAYLPSATCPVLFQSGATDEFFPPDSFQRSWDLIRSPKALCLRPDLFHGRFWLFPATEVEVNMFLDHHLAGGPPVPEVRLISSSENEIVCTVQSAYEIRGLFLASTDDLGPWSTRQWNQVELDVELGEGAGGDGPAEVRVELPEARPLVAFLSVGVAGPSGATGFFSSPYLFRYGQGSPEAIQFELSVAADGTATVRGERPRGRAVVLEASEDRCRWIQQAFAGGDGIGFEFAVPDGAARRRFFRVRNWDQVR